MIKKTRKSTAHQAPHSFKLTSMTDTKVMVQEAEKKVLEMEREGMDNLMHTAGDISKVANECAEACSGNLNACVEASTIATHTLEEISKGMLKNMKQNFADYAALSKEALACRNMNDITELQSKAVQCEINRYFERTTSLLNIIFNGYTKACEPIREHTATSSAHIRKALAA